MLGPNIRGKELDLPFHQVRLMVGLGETRDEILQLMNDLRADYLQNDNLQHRKLKASECVFRHLHYVGFAPRCAPIVVPLGHSCQKPWPKSQAPACFGSNERRGR